MLLSVRGVRLNVVDVGSGKPIVFVHGVGGDSTNWRPQIEEFRSSNRVIAIDSRGFGRSDRTYGDMTLGDFADDVIGVLDRLEVEQCVFVGLSMGGMIGQAVAVQAPSRLAGLVLSDTSSHANEEIQQTVIGAGDAAVSGGMGAVADMFAAASFTPDASARQLPCYLEFHEQFSSSDPHAFRIGLHAIAALDFTDQLKALEVPTLVLCGDGDAFTPWEHSERIHQAIPGSRLEKVVGAGHMANMEQPASFNSLLKQFLATINWI